MNFLPPLPNATQNAPNMEVINNSKNMETGQKTKKRRRQVRESHLHHLMFLERWKATNECKAF
jgi:hypothetical protein